MQQQQIKHVNIAHVPSLCKAMYILFRKNLMYKWIIEYGYFYFFGTIKYNIIGLLNGARKHKTLKFN